MSLNEEFTNEVHFLYSGWCTFNAGDTGNKNKQGAPCKFPFTYNGKNYNGDCVEDSNSENPWCFTSDDTSDSAPFGYCTSVCPKDGKSLPITVIQFVRKPLQFVQIHEIQ